MAVNADCYFLGIPIQKFRKVWGIRLHITTFYSADIWCTIVQAVCCWLITAEPRIQPRVTSYVAANGIGGVTHRFSFSPANHHSTSVSSSSVIAPEVCGCHYTQHIGISSKMGDGGTTLSRHYTR